MIVSKWRARYLAWVPITNPKLPDDYEPLKTIEFSKHDKLTALFDPPPGSFGEKLLDFMADKIVPMHAKHYMFRPHDDDLERSEFTGNYADMGAVSIVRGGIT